MIRIIMDGDTVIFITEDIIATIITMVTVMATLIIIIAEAIQEIILMVREVMV